jgi:RNA polymerase-binding transcription factor DksA
MAERMEGGTWRRRSSTGDPIHRRRLQFMDRRTIWRCEERISRAFCKEERGKGLRFGAHEREELQRLGEEALELQRIPP